MSIGQSIKVRPLVGWSGSSCLWSAASTSNLRMTWYLSWRTRCRIATAIRRSDTSKLCCNAVKLHFTACTTGKSWAAHNEFNTSSDMELLAYILCILMFYVFSLTSSDGICHLPKMFCVFSQLRATAFKISGPAGPAQRRGCSSHDIENIPTTNKKLPTTRKTFPRHRNGSSHVIGTTIQLWSLATLFGPPGSRNDQKGSPEWSCY